MEPVIKIIPFVQQTNQLQHLLHACYCAAFEPNQLYYKKKKNSSIGSARIKTILGDRTYDPFKVEVSAKDFKVVYIWFLNTYALSLGQLLGNLKEGSVWYLLLLNEKDECLQNG